MKKQWIMMAAVLCVSAAICAGCGESETNQDASENKSVSVDSKTQRDTAEESKENSGDESLEEPSLDEICQAVTDQVEFPAMMDVFDSEYLLNYFGIQSEDIEDGVFYMAEDVLRADVLTILKGKDADAVLALEERLEHYITSKENELIDYLPDQYAIVADARVVTEGLYVYLIISEHADEAVNIVAGMLP